jgi:cyclopropane-fatty-acyl-phospholipid synthase
VTIAALVQAVTDGEIPMLVEAYDGSAVGDARSGLTLKLHNERGLRYLLTAPGDLGLARAYVSGDLELVGAHHGDPYQAMRALSSWRFRRPTAKDVTRIWEDVGLRRLIPPPPPPQEAPSRLRRAARGIRHSRNRDAAAIGMHYDVSNRFYEYVLGPSMTYTCAVFPRPDASLEEAQEAKLDLVARKLGLRAGMRLLDVGCGWGSMARHAAKHYGV